MPCRRTTSILILVVLVAASACGSSSPPSNHAGGDPTIIPTSVANNPDLRSSVALSGCALAPGGWEASGTAGNQAKTVARYTITVFFTTGDATVEGFGSTKVDISPGKRADWRVRARFPADPTTTCVLRGVG